MPLPLIIIVASCVAGAGGVGAGIYGTVKMGSAKEQMEEINKIHESNIERFRVQNVETCGIMDRLGDMQLDVLRGFDDFSKIFEKVRDKPEFNYVFKNGASLPKLEIEEIKKVSVGAAFLLSGMGAGMAGAAGGFAASGAVSAAIAALGTTAKGVAIATLSGQAAINATLAALGGGALAAGGGGMALGQIVLGTASLGIGLLIGGVIFSFSSHSFSKKIDEAWKQVETETLSVDKICEYLASLRESGKKYYDALSQIRDIYNRQFRKLRYTVNVHQKTEYRSFTDEEKLNLQNTILLVGLLHEMCKVNLVVQNKNEDDINTVNQAGIDESILKAKEVLDEFREVTYERTDISDISSLTAEADSILDAF